jgi:hypothetical protein
MLWLGLPVCLLGAVVASAGLFRSFWPIAPGFDYQELSPPHRGELEQRIRNDPGEPDRAEPAGDLTLLRTAARTMFVQRNLLGLWLGCFLLQFGTTLASPTAVHVVVSILFAVPVGWLAMYFERRAAAGAAFLLRYPLPDTPARP